MPRSDVIEAPFPLVALHVGGDDAGAFLQSQLTADIDVAPPASWCPAAWCDPKGRVLFTLLYRIGREGVDLAVPEALADALAQRITMYRIGRKVTLSVARPLQPAPPNPEAGVHPLGFDASQGLTATEPEPPAPSTWTTMARAAIDRGMPWITPATSAQFLPQMIGLEGLDGLSYKKGCYPGQEIVARVHYLGRVTRRPVRLTGRGSPPDPGDELRLGEHAATVLYSVAESTGDDADGTPGYRALAVAPADLPEAMEDPASGLRWQVVDPHHAVLPSGA